MTTPSIPPPAELAGLPDFTDWRPGQPDAILAIAGWLDSDLPVLALEMPAGSGKTLIAAAAAQMAEKAGYRAVTLTPRRRLQDQMMRDLEPIAENLFGRPNYACSNAMYIGKGGHAGDAACAGQRSTCRDRNDKLISIRAAQCPDSGILQDDSYSGNGSCPYYAALDAARKANGLIANYRLAGAWQGRENSPFDQRWLVIADEAHLLLDEMTEIQSIDIMSSDCGLMGKTESPHDRAASEWEKRKRSKAVQEAASDWSEWAPWLGELAAVQAARARQMDDDSPEKLRLEETSHRLARVQHSQAGEYLVIAQDDALEPWESPRHLQRKTGYSGIAFRVQPIAPRIQQSWALENHKILLLSATLSDQTIQSLGLPAGSYAHHSIDPGWDASRAPVVQHPQAQDMGYQARQKTEHNGKCLDSWQQAFADAAAPRPATLWVSNARRYVDGRLWGVTELRLAGLRVADADTLEDVLQAHTADPQILASASIGVGYDFPGHLARRILIPAIPYPPTTDPLIAARQARWGWDWYGAMAAQTIAQMCGRGVRSSDDWCRVEILDSRWQAFAKRYRRHLPQWLLGRLAPWTPWQAYAFQFDDDDDPVVPDLGLAPCDDCGADFPFRGWSEDDDIYDPLLCESCQPA